MRVSFQEVGRDPFAIPVGCAGTKSTKLLQVGVQANVVVCDPCVLIVS